MFRFLVVLLAFAVASAQIIVNIEAGKNQDLGVYFPGLTDSYYNTPLTHKHATISLPLILSSICIPVPIRHCLYSCNTSYAHFC